jgi:hypothetical protein
MGDCVSIATEAVTLTDLRARAAAALAPVTDDDPAVFLDVVDALTPPAILLVWGDPWLTPQALRGWFDAQLEILCVASRVEPGPGITTLETLVTYAITRLRADGYPWPQASSQAPRIFEIAGVPYLGARVVYRVPVAIESEV